MKALISIDYTHDFIADKGALTTGQAGQLIESAMITLAASFIKQNDFVVFAIDAHNPEDKYHPLGKWYEIHKDSPQVYWMNKRHYSAFCGTDLDLRLRERHINEIHLSGVCTDICILHTAIDAYNLGYKIVIHQNAVASFDPIGHQWALNHFQKTLGATLI